MDSASKDTVHQLAPSLLKPHYASRSRRSFSDSIKDLAIAVVPPVAAATASMAYASGAESTLLFGMGALVTCIPCAAVASGVRTYIYRR